MSGGDVYVVCPACDDPFDVMKKYPSTRVVSVSTDNLKNVCFYPVHDEVWVYFHLADDVTPTETPMSTGEK